MTETQFRDLCSQYGGPDEAPCDAMPEEIAATLSQADRFFDADDIEDAIELIREAGLFAEVTE